jgi:hypothetical protein
MLAKSSMAIAAVLLGFAAWLGAAPAAEQKPAPDPEDPAEVVGTLTCSLMGKREGAGQGIGQDITCQFQPGSVGAIETYTGSLQGVGKTDLLFGKGAVLLVVKAPASVKLRPGVLAQTYAADAAASGSAAAPLSGEKNKWITLHPLAEQEGRVAQGKTQPEAVIIVVELALQSTPA